MANGLIKIKTSLQTTFVSPLAIVAIAAVRGGDEDPYVVIYAMGGKEIWMKTASWEEACAAIEEIEL